MIGLFFIWVIWLAFIVQKWRVFESFAGSSKNTTCKLLLETWTRMKFISIITSFLVHRDSPWISQYFFDSAPLEFGDWQRQTFRWWPALFAEYNLSLSGHYITFLPPIVLEAVVDAENPILTPKPFDTQEDFAGTEQELQNEAPELK
jgi:hypothetical protein